MNLRPARLLKLFGIFSISVAFLATIAFVMPTLAKAQSITIDVAIQADIRHNLGIGLNFIGDRPNIIEPLKNLQVGTLRYATNESYLFDLQEPNNPKVAIQDPSLWQVNSFAKPDGTWWGKLNFDQFMKICRSTKAEPFVVVSIDAIAYQGTAPHATPEAVLAAAVDWVKYANVIKGYQVKYWEIGNESNVKHHEKINWTPEQYAQTVVQFAQAMKQVDPTIKIGANGMRIEQNDDWWSRVMPIVKDNVDFLVTHQYSWQENYEAWQNATDRYDYNIQDAVKAIATYNPKLELSITENSSFNPSVTHPNNTWKMLHNFEMLGQTLSINGVDYVHFWTSRWFEEDSYAEDNSAFDTDYRLTPMGYPLKVWNQFLKPKIVQSTSTDPAAISAWGSYDPDSYSLSLFLLNKDRIRQNIRLILKNYPVNDAKNQRWILQGTAPESQDVTWKQSGSAIARGAKITAQLEPLSVTVIALEPDLDRS